MMNAVVAAVMAVGIAVLLGFMLLVGVGLVAGYYVVQEQPELCTDGVCEESLTQDNLDFVRTPATDLISRQEELSQQDPNGAVMNSLYGPVNGIAAAEKKSND